MRTAPAFLRGAASPSPPSSSILAGALDHPDPGSAVTTNRRHAGSRLRPDSEAFAWAAKLALVILLLPLPLPLPAAVQGQFTTAVNPGGTITITKYACTASVVTIPDSIDGRRVTDIGDSAFSGGSDGVKH